MWRFLVLSAFIGLLPVSAANAEVTECKVITTLPAVIDSSGVWCLKQDLVLNGQGPAIHIQRSFVTLDLNGYRLVNRAGSSSGMAIFGYDLTNVTVRNGTIFGFRQGIALLHTPQDPRAGRHLVESMKIEKSELAAIDVSGDGNIVRGNHIALTRPSAGSTSRGISVQEARNNVVSGNTVSGTTGIGIQIFNSQMIEVRGNSVFDTRKNGQTAWGIWVAAFSRAVMVEGNRIINASNGTNGILVDNNPTMVSCINNVVVGYATAIDGCSFESGNLTP